MTPLTQLASTIVLGAGANSENLPMGLAYGLRGLRIGLAPNLAIAGVTTAATLLPLAAGRGLRRHLPEWLPDVLAGLLLIALGLSGILLDRRRRRRSAADPPQAHGGAAAAIGWRETLVLAGALSANNVGLGFAGGIAGLSHGPVALSVAGFSILLLWLGQYLSRTIALSQGGTWRWRMLDGNILIIAVGLLVLIGL